MANLLDISLLNRNRSFALLYFGQFVSFLGTMITMVALPFQIYEATHSTVMVGMLSFAQLLPLIFTALIGGVFADRHARRRLLLISECLLALGCIALAINAKMALPNMVVIFVMASLMSAITGLHRPAFEGAIQQLVQEADYKTVGALRSFEFSFCMIVGPAITGLIVAKFGVAITYSLDFVTFLCSIISLICLGPLPNPNQQASISIFQALKEGIQFAWNREVLLGSYCVDFIAMVFAMPNALFPAIALSIGGVKTLGLLYAAPAVGSLLLSVWSGWTASIKHEGRAIAISAACWGMAMIGFGLSHALIWALFFLALAGAFDACSGIFRTSLWNNAIPHNFRGRLAGIEMLSYLSGPKLGDTRAGLMAATMGIAPAIISGGLFCVLGVWFCCRRMPAFWRYKKIQ
jgi:MFS family permease